MAAEEYYHDDPFAAYDDAHDAGINYLWSLSEMQNTVLLALTAGMYHQFDKKLREHTIRELSNWCKREIITLMVWDLSFHRLCELLEWIGLKISGTKYGESIKACNLVVNVYKHGDGDAHRKLSCNHPEYYPYATGFRRGKSEPKHDDLHVSEEQFVSFSDSITSFWKAVPEECYYLDLKEPPTWLDKVVGKVEKNSKTRSSQTI